MRAYDRSRVTSETADERQARLQWLCTNQQKRPVVEPADERQARLQRLRIRTNQQGKRLAAEPDEQRQGRLQRMRAQNHMRKHACVHRLKHGASSCLPHNALDSPVNNIDCKECKLT